GRRTFAAAGKIILEDSIAGQQVRYFFAVHCQRRARCKWQTLLSARLPQLLVRCARISRLDALIGNPAIWCVTCQERNNSTGSQVLVAVIRFCVSKVNQCTEFTGTCFPAVAE